MAENMPSQFPGSTKIRFDSQRTFQGKTAALLDGHVGHQKETMKF